jgi:hypothetical protein
VAAPGTKAVALAIAATTMADLMINFISVSLLQSRLSA